MTKDRWLSFRDKWCCKEATGPGSHPSIDQDLYRGERVLWTAQPQGVLLAPIDVMLAPLGVGIVIVLSLVISLALDAGQLVLLVGASLILASGLYVTFLRFWLKARWRRATIYAVTDQRVMEKSGDDLRFESLAPFLDWK